MLPPTHKALVQEEHGQPLVVKDIATPQPTPGSAIIRVVAAPIISYVRDVYNGTRKYDYPTPLVTGTSCIGRVAATGPDAVLLKEGDLVFFDCTVRGRDDSEAIVLSGLSGGGSDASRKLLDGEWRDSTYAEYAKVPLENTFRLDEGRLCGSPQQGGMGYTPTQLTLLLMLLVPYGGLRSVNLLAGETVIISPATGGFGSAAVVVALAMGARVITMGRNEEELAKLKLLSNRVEAVKMTGDHETEMAALKGFGKVDVFFDISPKNTENSTYFKSGIVSLRREGRVSLMGGMLGDVSIPHRYIMRNDILLKGKWMYERSDVLSFLRLVHSGVLDLREIVKVLGEYKLEEWKTALDTAANGGRLGQVAVFTP